MQPRKNSTNPPGSGTITKKQLDIDRLKELIPDATGPVDSNIFVLGICGGDCAGKKQLISYMFDNVNGELVMKDSKQTVSILHQDYFFLEGENKFVSKGTNWKEFERAILKILAGNEVVLKNVRQKGTDIVIKPGKFMIVEGSHIFMENKPIERYIDSKIFIDSDSDVRVSRRIYKDTQDDGMELKDSIKNYLTYIKTSYEQEIEPCKTKCDIIIPHFGGGYDDHRRQHRVDYSSNIRSARALILAHIREKIAHFDENQEI